MYAKDKQSNIDIIRIVSEIKSKYRGDARTRTPTNYNLSEQTEFVIYYMHAGGMQVRLRTYKLRVKSYELRACACQIDPGQIEIVSTVFLHVPFRDNRGVMLSQPDLSQMDPSQQYSYSYSFSASTAV